MALRDWRPLQKTLQRTVPAGWQALPLPTTATLDAFEEQSGIRLPNSYREFMQLFGPGVLAENFLIFGPACEIRPLDLGIYNKDWAKMWKRNPTLYERFYDDPAQARRLVIFSRTQDNDLFCWDPADVRDARRHEYGVLSLPRLAERPTTVARTFREFVEEVCLGPGYYTKYLGTKAVGQELMPATFGPARARKTRWKAQGRKAGAKGDMKDK